MQTIRDLFTNPLSLADKVKERKKQLRTPDWTPVPRDAIDVEYTPLKGKRQELQGKESSYSHFNEGEDCPAMEMTTGKEGDALTWLLGYVDSVQ